MARRTYYNDWNWHSFFPKSTPREAKGGIKAQSKRGTFGESWWAIRWIEVLESFNIGARLQRGRSYARRGQVTSIDIAEGLIKAKVQGSRPKPYKVEIRVDTLSQADWQKLTKILADQAIYAAKLLAGEMPQDIEDAFRQAKLSLFPQKQGDLKTNCSCPDWSNPCKHIAAVYYLLGEEFDRDPFLIFRLRGIAREDFVKLLTKAGGKSVVGKRGVKSCEPADISSPESAMRSPVTEPLVRDPAAFWGKPDFAPELFGDASIPTVSAALCRRLGSLPFWRGGTNFMDEMASIYASASPAAMDVFLGRHSPRSQPSS
jgi:uncharacterized Zn finger protein